MAQGLTLSWDAQQSPTTESKGAAKKTRTMGQRRIFSPRFKLQVLHSYRNDAECKGNQRATARKYNIHRRQIQKWLQCEGALRLAAEETVQTVNGNQKFDSETSDRRGPIIFKNEVQNLKRVAQKLYPSSGCQLNDTSNRANATVEATDRGVIIRNDVSTINVGSMSERDVQKYQPLPSTLTPPPPRVHTMPNHDFYYPSSIDNQPCPFGYLCGEENRPQVSPSSSISNYSDSSEEPCNLVKPSVATSTPPSAFSPKRKWIRDNLLSLPPKERIKQGLLGNNQNDCCPPPAKQPSDFSIARLSAPPSPKPKPLDYPTIPYQPFVPTVLSFPPPLVLPNRTIPELRALHFKPEEPVKDEMSDDEDEPIDVTSTTPVEKKSFDFPPSRRRSFPLEFKLDVIDAYRQECDQNQRATARKFGINRRQVQKWISQEYELRQMSQLQSEAGNCKQCPPKTLKSSDLQPLSLRMSPKPFQGCMPICPNMSWSQTSALPVPNLPYEWQRKSNQAMRTGRTVSDEIKDRYKDTALVIFKELSKAPPTFNYGKNIRRIHPTGTESLASGSFNTTYNAISAPQTTLLIHHYHPRHTFRYSQNNFI